MCLETVYIAHISENGKIQSIKDHAKGTAEKACGFSVCEVKKINEASGLGHDIGKYQASFNDRILGKDVRVEHSICGAKEAMAKYGENSPEGLLIALCIAGHHTGIPDVGRRYDLPSEPTLYGRLQRETEDYSAYRKEIRLPEIGGGTLSSIIEKTCNSQQEAVEEYAFWVRYCFSCLVDADTADTLQAMGGSAVKPLTADFPACLELINKKLKSFAPVTGLQKARSRIQKQAFENIEKESDIYLMGMPTGSGKTLAGMKCALELAIRENKKRIIYVIPYNSIIDQTVCEFEKVFGNRAQILRHQSSFSYKEDENISEDYRKSAIYGCENWDAKIIITTSVQFFESLYSSRRGKTRKIHNIADSVLVFDEAHLMPVEYLQPCLRAVAFSTKCLHSKAVFLTATMPDYKSMIKQYGLEKAVVADLVTDHSDYKYFQKNTYEYIGKTRVGELAEKSSGFSSSLIVVNSRKKAREVFEKCRSKKYHLSKYMTGKDIERTILKIQDSLSGLKTKYPDGNVPESERVVVVSTSLIQAGGDLDFESAFREISGLDDILQTGGRVNREGTRKTGYVFIFEFEGAAADRDTVNITRGIIREFGDISSDEAVAAYYDRFFRFNAEKIIGNSLFGTCKRWNRINLRSYEMKMIQDTDVSVIALTDDRIKRIVEAGKRNGYINEREIQGYCFSIKRREAEQMQSRGMIEAIGSVYMLTDERYYNAETGVQMPGADIAVG